MLVKKGIITRCPRLSILYGNLEWEEVARPSDGGIEDCGRGADAGRVIWYTARPITCGQPQSFVSHEGDRPKAVNAPVLC